jgi:hypothetical protein
LIVAIAAAIVLGLWPPPAGTPAALLLPAATFALVIVSWFSMRRHDRNLCEICVCAMPLNAAELASRHQRRLALVHAGSKRELVIGYLIVLLGSNVILGEGFYARLCWAAIQSTMIYLVLAYSSHRKLQPWCPWCSEGGGGGDDRAIAPDPMPQGGRSH